MIFGTLDCTLELIFDVSTSNVTYCMSSSTTLLQEENTLEYYIHNS